MATVEVCEKEVQTSRPPTEHHSVLTSSQSVPSVVSDYSYKSSDAMSEGKLDSLFTNSMKILVRRANDKGGDSRRPSGDLPVEPTRSGQTCSVAGCTGMVGTNLPPLHHGIKTDSDAQSHLDNYSAQSGYLDRRSIEYARHFGDFDQGNTSNGRHSGQQSRSNGRYTDHLRNSSQQSKPKHSSYRRYNSASTDHSSLRLDGISTLPRGTTLQDFNLGFRKQESDTLTSVDQRKPYRPISKPRPAFTRSKTSIPCTPVPASRQCDACSVRDLQSWFIMNPGNASPRSPNDVISPTRLTREKSQVYLLNKQPSVDCIGENMAEVLLPMTTVPKKGLIKLTCLDEDTPHRENTFHTDKPRTRRREPLRPLIKNRKLLAGIQESYNLLLEKERLESEQVQRLLTQEQSVHLAAL